MKKRGIRLGRSMAAMPSVPNFCFGSVAALSCIEVSELAISCSFKTRAKNFSFPVSGLFCPSHKPMELRLKFASKPSVVQIITIKLAQKRLPVKAKTGVNPESFKRP